ncbi:MAG: VOC family protein [Burkholderiaceae bacterium]
MIGYVTLGTNDLERATAFYDTLFGEFGGKRTMESDRFVAWSMAPRQPALMVARPYDGQPMTVGNGAMTALAVDSKDKVGQMYEKALSLGATSEGAVGPRGTGGFYGGYFRDLDGNKLAVFTIDRG